MLTHGIPGTSAETSPADPTTDATPRDNAGSAACRTPVTLDAQALADLQAGGTPPAPVGPNPTSRAVRALQALASLLLAHGDLHEEEALLPYIREGWITGAGDSTARALIQAHHAGELTEFSALAWREVAGGRQVREVWGVFEGVRIQGTQRWEAQVCTHCAGSGLAGKTAVACGDCGGAS